VNIAPYQGSRTIRTEEAVFITLSRLSPYISKNGMASEAEKASPMKQKAVVKKTDDVEFSDEAVSEESSDDEES